MKILPAILTRPDGSVIRTADEFEARRRELVDTLAHEEYGYLPPAPAQVSGEVTATEQRHCAGKALLEKVNISFETEKGVFSFPFNMIINLKKENAPLFLFLNFSDRPYDRYLPLEEIIDAGFNVAEIYYEDITSDDGDMQNGLAGMFTRPDDGTGYGKISLWAYGASRVLDYLVTREDIRTDLVACIGHSRLGKTALWCGANDTRIKYSISGNSGCGGAALDKIKHEGSETIAHMNRVFPFWFCENRRKYADNIDSMPFDQHWLIAASAPRCVCVGSAQDDLWADPYSEQLACIGASAAWEVCGKTGYAGKEEPAVPGDNFDGGCVSYHLRAGTHFLSRLDWQIYIDFIKKREGEE